jgi:Peptidase inhibitor family I36
MAFTKRRLRAAVSAVFTSALVVAGLAVGAAPAQAACGDSGWFCAWDSGSYSGTALVRSTTTGSATVDVADDKVASAKNDQTRRWCGVDTNIAGVPYILFSFGANSDVSNLGSANDRINWFWPRGAGSCT